MTTPSGSSDLSGISVDDLLGPTISPEDTCDRCGPGTTALIAFRLPSGRKLTFCNHHARVHAPAIFALGEVSTSAAWFVPASKEVPSDPS